MARATKADRGASGESAGGSLTYLRVLQQVVNSGITQVELGQAVGAAPRTVQNWASGEAKPTGIKAQKLLDVRTVVELLQDSYTDEGIRIWLHSRNRNLHLERPIDLLTQGRIDEVLEEAQSVSGGF